MLGYPVGDIDGLIGPRTRNAWAEYKSDIFPGNPQLIGAESIDRLRQDLLKLAAWETANFGSKQGTIDAIKGMCQAMGIGLPAQIAYVLATTQWETAQTFQPVKEAFWLDEAWRQANLSYYPYYGRGYVQLTWDKNYEAYSDILAIDLVSNPDRALDPTVALFVLVHGFKTGTFTGRKITDFIAQGMTDFVGARRCINGTDKANEIASLLAEKFLTTAAPSTAGTVGGDGCCPGGHRGSHTGGRHGGALATMNCDGSADRETFPETDRTSGGLRAETAPPGGRVYQRTERQGRPGARDGGELRRKSQRWISQIYAPNKASQACQQWVLGNPQATTAQAIAAGLLGTMNALTDTELGQMSRHLSGDAFDIQPLEPDNAGIKEAIRALPGLRLFLDREGGLVRWHAEFNA